MHTIEYAEIENATLEDVGKIALFHIGGSTIAIEDTIEDCIDTARKCACQPITYDDHTDPYYLTTEDTIAVIIGG